jgi:hypothetical protein
VNPTDSPPVRPPVALLIASALGCGAVAGTVDLPVARISATLVLALLLPGYAVSVLVFGRRGVGRAELLMFSVGVSLAVSALGGLLLDGLPGYLDRVPWALLLTAVTVCAAVGSRLVPAEAKALSPSAGPGQPPPRSRVSKVPPISLGLFANCVMGAAALAIAAGAIAVARDAARIAPAFTELSALPTGTGTGARMVINVSSHEHHTMRFALLVLEDGHVGQVVHLLLAPGESRRLLTRTLSARVGRVVVELGGEGELGPHLHTVYYFSARSPIIPARRKHGGHAKGRRHVNGRGRARTHAHVSFSRLRRSSGLGTHLRSAADQRVLLVPVDLAGTRSF